MAEQEDDRLAGLLHPIRQCPEDILKLIFECVAHDDEDQLFMVATTLSHVCRRWRAIMLGIPSLWSQINVSMDTDDIKDLRSFMKRVKERVGTSPVNVTIRDVVSDFTFRTNFMERMDLQYFTTITSLEYRLVSSKDVLLLRGPPLSKQTANLKQLIISAPPKFTNSRTWNMAQQLGPSPNIESIQLCGLGIVAFEGLTTLPSLRRLHVLDMQAPDLPQFLAQHSQLQELIIEGNLFTMEEFIEDIVLPELTVMKIKFVGGFPWDTISTPLLRTVETDDDSDSARAFLCRHPAIHTLRYLTPINEAEFKDLAKSMVNLTNLAIGGFIDGLFKEIDPDIPFPPFPKLKILVFNQILTPQISLEEFEQILRIRSLPREPSDTNKTQRISELAIHLRSKELDSVPWRQSVLLAHIPQTVSKWGVNEANCTVSLKIPN
jgi:hypothetical protein